MYIEVPNLSTHNALEFCKSLYEKEKDNIYLFDVTKTKNYEPFPMLLVSTAIRQFCKQRNLSEQNMQLIYDNNIYSYPCHMGFFRAAGFQEGKVPGEALGSTSYIPLTKINVCDLQTKSDDFPEQGEIIEQEAKRLANILAQNNVELGKLLQYLIREAMRNIPEHAETNDIWICGQYWQSKNEAEIAILDEGIGVYESLKRNLIYKKYISSNEGALRWALQPGISAAFNPASGKKSNNVWSNSGYGLYIISEICRKTNGWFTFVSGDECIRVYPDETKKYETKFNGTALGIKINISNLSTYQSIIDSIRKEGEIKAKNIKHAFKEASIPSKGLLF